MKERVEYMEKSEIKEILQGQCKQKQKKSQNLDGSLVRLGNQKISDLGGRIMMKKSSDVWQLIMN